MSKNNIEAIYRLSPLQEGLMFHALYDPGSSVYFIQSNCIMRGELNPTAFKLSWEQVVKRHAILRTAFLWGERERPLQVVRGQVDLSWQEQDWRGLSGEQQQERLELLLREDREREFDLSKAPLTRFSLIRLDESVYHFTWSFHHLLLDAWARALVVAEVFKFYQAYQRGEPIYLQRSRPYKDYVAWLERQDKSKAEAYWRETLKGISGPTSLNVAPPAEKAPPGHAHDEKELYLSPEATAGLKAFAREHKLTLNTIAQGAWGLLLSRYSGQQDVVFGATVSGRPAELEGVEQMVGLFINTLPVRLKVGGEQRVSEWLVRLQQEQAEMRQYEHSSLLQVRKWSDVPGGLPLFESNLTFQNFPVSDSLFNTSENLRVSQVRSVEDAHFPLVVVVEPGERLRLLFSYDCRRYERSLIKRILRLFSELLSILVANAATSLSEVMSIINGVEIRERINEENELKQTRLETIRAIRRKVIAPSQVKELKARNPLIIDWIKGEKV